MSNSLQKADIGKYFYIRSSENEEAMLRWGSLEYDVESSRWFEFSGFGYCDFRDAKAMQEANDIEIEDFRIAHPDICVRETFCDMVFDDAVAKTAQILAVFVDYEKDRTRSCSLRIEHADAQKINRLMDKIRDWHITGELIMDDMVYSGDPVDWDEY